ncbi:MAG: hypothetical protein IPG76_01090 [Acidobacteria bacterium]|nr:hypothetical protein [Acidobacteriota bacterium]
MNNRFDELVTRLKDGLGNDLVSIIAYGSAINSTGKTNKSDHQLLVVTRHLNITDLRKVTPVIKWLVSDGYAMPTLFTGDELENSLDVYPIEFRHMKQSYKVLFGKDLLGEQQISKDHLRWQTEHELRGKLMRLRSLYIPASESNDDLLKLMTDSIVSFVRLLRPVLEMFGEEPPVSRMATVKNTGEKLKIDTSPLARILDQRNEPKELMGMEIQDLFSGYLDCLTRVTEAVDRLQ